MQNLFFALGAHSHQNIELETRIKNVLHFNLQRMSGYKLTSTMHLPPTELHGTYASALTI